jgi:hypothetical protein
MACVTPYVTALPDKAPEPSGEDTVPTQVTTPVSDEGTTPEEVVDETDVDTDTTETDTQDTEIEVIDHPTMDENGNPLYPTIPDDFEDTGVAPPSVPGSPGTLSDCNIPDDFMLVTYFDLDQDGYGSQPYTETVYPGYQPIPAQAPSFIFNVITSGTAGNYVNYFSDAYQEIRDLSTVYPGINANEVLHSEPISREAINLFPEIYNQSSGINRFHSALEVINNESGLPYELTAQMAMTTHRKEFRNELIFIAQQRCAADNACFRTNYREFTTWNPSLFGFSQNIFLTYAIWRLGSNGYYDIGSPYSAAFWRGDDQYYEHSYEYTITIGCGRNDGCGQATRTFMHKLDIEPSMNEGFYVCDWFSDDADGDGYSLEDGDCNDGAAWISPAAEEIPSNEVDNNCDGFEDCFADMDGDSFLGITNIIQVEGYLCPLGDVRPSDCDDSNANISPASPEVACDGLDNNCDGQDM